MCVCKNVDVRGVGMGGGSQFQKQAAIPIGLNSLKLFDMSILECL